MTDAVGGEIEYAESPTVFDTSLHDNTGVTWPIDTDVDVTEPYPDAENVNVPAVPAFPFRINGEKSATPFASMVTVAFDNVAEPDVAVNDAVTDTPDVDNAAPAASIN